MINKYNKGMHGMYVAIIDAMKLPKEQWKEFRKITGISNHDVSKAKIYKMWAGLS